MKTKCRKHLAEKIADLEKAVNGLVNMYADLSEKCTALATRVAALEEVKHMDDDDAMTDKELFKQWTVGDDK